MPGNIRQAHHFLNVLKRLVGYLKGRLQSEQTKIEIPLKFLHSIKQQIAVDRATLKYLSKRLSSLLTTLQLPNIHEFYPIIQLADFATVLATYEEGFAIVIEPKSSPSNEINPQGEGRGSGKEEKVLELSCLDASIAMRYVLSKFASVIITSGFLLSLLSFFFFLFFSSFFHSFFSFFFSFFSFSSNSPKSLSFQSYSCLFFFQFKKKGR